MQPLLTSYWACWNNWCRHKTYETALACIQREKARVNREGKKADKAAKAGGRLFKRGEFERLLRSDAV